MGPTKDCIHLVYCTSFKAKQQTALAFSCLKSSYFLIAAHQAFTFSILYVSWHRIRPSIMKYALINGLEFLQIHFFLLVKLCSGITMLLQKIQLPNKAEKQKHWKTMTLCYARAGDEVFLPPQRHCRLPR